MLLFAGLLTYWNSLHGAFLLDDWPTFLDNDALKHLWPADWLRCSASGGLTTDGRPLVALTVVLNWLAGGASPTGFHAVNIAIHLLGALALFGLVRVTLQRPVLAARFASAAVPVAFCAALLWVVHPITTAAVTYVIQRAEALAALFFLLTLYAFARSLERPERRGWFVISVVACTLGMATKETMATAPVLLLLYDRTFGAGSFHDALRLRWRRHAAYAAGWLLLGGLVLSTGSRGGSAGATSVASLLAYLSTQVGGVIGYLRLTFWPTRLIFDYGMETTPFAEVVPQAVLLAGLLGAAAFAFWRRPVVGFGLAAWFILLAPSSSIVPVITQVLVEHRAYLPTAVVATLVSCGLFLLLGRRPAWLCGVTLLAAVALATLTIRRNELFRNAQDVWHDTIAKRPLNSRAHFSLAVELQRAGRVTDALPHFRRALELRPDSSEGRHGYGMALIVTGDREEGVRQLEAALAIQPRRLDTIVNLGQTLLALRRSEAAVSWLEKAVEIDPVAPEPRINLAAALTQVGSIEKARDVLITVVRDRPAHVGAHYNLALQYARLRQTADAEREYRAALALAPEFVDAHQNLGNLLMRERRPAEAATAFRNAVRAAPEESVLHCSLAVALAESGRPAEGVAVLREFLTAHPDDARARGFLAELQGRP